LHRLSREEALLFVDDALGTSDAWPSPLIAYRLHDAFQAEWKCELGQWLAAAKQYGFINVVLDQLRAQAQHQGRESRIAQRYLDLIALDRALDTDDSVGADHALLQLRQREPGLICNLLRGCDSHTQPAQWIARHYPY